MSLLNQPTASERGRNGKTALLIAQLRDEIQRGARQPGQQLPSFAEMRRLHGVAPPTTDRIYGQLERDGLVRRENGRGIFVREQRRARTGIIGFSGASTLTPSGHRSSYFGPLLEGVQHAAERAHYEVLLLNANSQLSWEKLDGVLVSQGFSAESLSQLPPGMPLVSMVMEWDNEASILSEDYAAMCQLTQHLLNLGHRRIAIISAGEDQYSRERHRAYEDTLRAAGIVPRPQWRRLVTSLPVQPGFDVAGHRLMQQWIEEDWKAEACTAIMAYNDDTAVGVMVALADAGYAVPTQISVTGFDGVDTPRHLPRLTTAVVPLQEIGRNAFQSLRGWMEDDVKAQTLHLPAQFSAGDTTCSVLQT